MGSTYETDLMENVKVLQLTIMAAALIKATAQFVDCRSCLQARLTVKRIHERFNDVFKFVEDESNNEGTPMK